MEWVNELAAWAWARHHNILSWYIRPLFLLPFCFFAYRRSLPGIGAHPGRPGHQHGVVPGAGEPEPGGGRDADAERDYLFGPWNAAKVVALADDPGHLHRSRPRLLAPVDGLGAGGDQRSGVVQDRLDLAVSGTAGANAHLLPALAGLIMVDARDRHRRPAGGRRRTGRGRHEHRRHASAAGSPSSGSAPAPHRWSCCRASPSTTTPPPSASPPLRLVDAPPGRGRTVTVLRRPRGIAAPRSPASHRRHRGPVRLGAGDQPGPVDVMGLSTGGLIAQHLALRHPELVWRLVLAVTGARIAEPGRQLCQAWLVQVQRRDWRALRGTLTASAVDGRTAQRIARLLGGSGRQPDPRDVADFEATVRADLRHDTSTALPDMRVPTLILGGRDDPFFPEPLLRATAAAIPGAHVPVHTGGHGVPRPQPLAPGPRRGLLRPAAGHEGRRPAQLPLSPTSRWRTR